MNIVNMEYLKNRLVRYVNEAPVISCDKLLFANYPLIISPGYPVPPSLEISDKKWTDENEEIAERQWGNNRSLIKKKRKMALFGPNLKWKETQTDHQDTRIVYNAEEHLTSELKHINIDTHLTIKRKSFGKKSRCCNCVVTPRSVWLLQWPCLQVGVDSLFLYSTF